jgi:hypothetical protein
VEVGVATDEEVRLEAAADQTNVMFVHGAWLST